MKIIKNVYRTLATGLISGIIAYTNIGCTSSLDFEKHVPNWVNQDSGTNDTDSNTNPNIDAGHNDASYNNDAGKNDNTLTAEITSSATDGIADKTIKTIVSGSCADVTTSNDQKPGIDSLTISKNGHEIKSANCDGSNVCHTDIEESPDQNGTFSYTVECVDFDRNTAKATIEITYSNETDTDSDTNTDNDTDIDTDTNNGTDTDSDSDDFTDYFNIDTNPLNSAAYGTLVCGSYDASTSIILGDTNPTSEDYNKIKKELTETIEETCGYSPDNIKSDNDFLANCDGTNTCDKNKIVIGTCDNNQVIKDLARVLTGSPDPNACKTITGSDGYKVNMYGGVDSNGNPTYVTLIVGENMAKTVKAAELFGNTIEATY